MGGVPGFSGVQTSFGGERFGGEHAHIQRRPPTAIPPNIAVVQVPCESAGGYDRNPFWLFFKETQTDHFLLAPCRMGCASLVCQFWVLGCPPSFSEPLEPKALWSYGRPFLRQREQRTFGWGWLRGRRFMFVLCDHESLGPTLCGKARGEHCFLVPFHTVPPQQSLNITTHWGLGDP